jgi:hypothetical protein
MDKAADSQSADTQSYERLKKLGAGRRENREIARLYNRAFRQYGTLALWNRRPSEMPTVAQALVVAETLRREGNLQSRAFAAEIERACRAALMPQRVAKATPKATNKTARKGNRFKWITIRTSLPGRIWSATGSIMMRC